LSVTARLFRRRDGFAPSGPVVDFVPGPLDEGAATVSRISYQVVPRSCEAEAGDVWAVGEVLWLLVARCGPNHGATRALVESMHDHYDDPAAVDEWLARHEVWRCELSDGSDLERLRGLP